MRIKGDLPSPGGEVRSVNFDARLTQMLSIWGVPAIYQDICLLCASLCLPRLPRCGHCLPITHDALLHHLHSLSDLGAVMPPQDLPLPDGGSEGVAPLLAAGERVEDAVALALLRVPEGGDLAPVGVAHVGEEREERLRALLGDVQGRRHELLGEGGEAQRRRRAHVPGREQHGREAADQQDRRGLQVHLVGARVGAELAARRARGVGVGEVQGPRAELEVGVLRDGEEGLPEVRGEEGEVEVQVRLGVVRVLTREQGERGRGAEEGLARRVPRRLIVVVVLGCFCCGFGVLTTILVRVAVPD